MVNPSNASDEDLSPSLKNKEILTQEKDEVTFKSQLDINAKKFEPSKESTILDELN